MTLRDFMAVIDEETELMVVLDAIDIGHMSVQGEAGALIKMLGDEIKDMPVNTAWARERRINVMIGGGLKHE